MLDVRQPKGEGDFKLFQFLTVVFESKLIVETVTSSDSSQLEFVTSLKEKRN